MKPFDLSNAPSGGVNLIEASAGTGKTFTLTGLCLRLIVEQGLRIDQILVVTLSNAVPHEVERCHPLTPHLVVLAQRYFEDTDGGIRSVAAVQLTHVETALGRGVPHEVGRCHDLTPHLVVLAQRYRFGPGGGIFTSAVETNIKRMSGLRHSLWGERRF